MILLGRKEERACLLHVPSTKQVRRYIKPTGFIITDSEPGWYHQMLDCSHQYLSFGGGWEKGWENDRANKSSSSQLPVTNVMHELWSHSLYSYFNIRLILLCDIRIFICLQFLLLYLNILKFLFIYKKQNSNNSFKLLSFFPLPFNNKFLGKKGNHLRLKNDYLFSIHSLLAASQLIN